MFQNKYNTALLFILMVSHFSYAALSPTNYTTYKDHKFIFVENQEDNNYFVTPSGPVDPEPRLTGASAWTSLKGNQQKSLAYASPGINGTINNLIISAANSRNGWHLDMWEEGGPIAFPYTTQRCQVGNTNCDSATATAVNPPQVIDEKGFYGLIAAQGGAQASISDAYFSYLRNMRVGGVLTSTLNWCYTSVAYDATQGGRCIDQSKGTWARKTVNQTKTTHLTLKRTNAVTNLMVDSTGTPIILPGSTGCEMGNVGNRDGVICEFLEYDLEGGNHANILLSTRMISGFNLSDTYQLRISADKSTWARHNTNMSTLTTYNLTLKQLMGHNKIYVFMGKDFLRQVVSSGLDDLKTRGFFNFLFRNKDIQESGYYELSGTTEINIQPREFSVSIRSSDSGKAPYKEGKVGEDKLKFNYDIVKSAPMASSSFNISIKQDIPGTDDNGYCLFYPQDSSDRNRAVPVPAYIEFKTKQAGGTFRSLINCDSGVISLQDNDIDISLPTISEELPDEPGKYHTIEFYNLDLELDLTDNVLLRTLDNSYWEGEVHQSGTITVEATWE